MQPSELFVLIEEACVILVRPLDCEAAAVHLRLPAFQLQLLKDSRLQASQAIVFQIHFDPGRAPKQGLQAAPSLKCAKGGNPSRQSIRPLKHAHSNAAGCVAKLFCTSMGQLPTTQLQMLCATKSDEFVVTIMQTIPTLPP